MTLEGRYCTVQGQSEPDGFCVVARCLPGQCRAHIAALRLDTRNTPVEVRKSPVGIFSVAQGQLPVGACPGMSEPALHCGGTPLPKGYSLKFQGKGQVLSQHNCAPHANTHHPRPDTHARSLCTRLFRLELLLFLHARRCLLSFIAKRVDKRHPRVPDAPF
jgi:hypothetical protein